MKKQRGFLLILLIVFMSFSYIFNLMNYSEYNSMQFLLSVLGIISLLGIWIWKKWGVYLQIIIYTISLVITLFALQSPQSKGFGAVYPLFVTWMTVWGLVPVVLGYIVLKKKWKYFN